MHHRFPDAAHQLPTPHSNPEAGEGAEERPGRHAHGAAHDEAHLDAVEAAGLGLALWTMLPSPLSLQVRPMLRRSQC